MHEGAPSHESIFDYQAHQESVRRNEKSILEIAEQIALIRVQIEKYEAVLADPKNAKAFESDSSFEPKLHELITGLEDVIKGNNETIDILKESIRKEREMMLMLVKIFSGGNGTVQ